MGMIEEQRKALYNKYYGRWYKVKPLEWYEELKKTDRNRGDDGIKSPIHKSELIFNPGMVSSCGKYFKVVNASCDFREVVLTPDRSFGGRFWSFGEWMVDEVETKQTFQNTEKLLL